MGKTSRCDVIEADGAADKIRVVGSMTLIVYRRAGLTPSMKAYSTDLRKKILEAVYKGMPKSESARTFGVSRSSAKRYAATRREGKSLVPKKHPGSKPKLDESARKILEADVEE
jgi:hypothetical protein